MYLERSNGHALVFMDIGWSAGDLVVRVRSGAVGTEGEQRDIRFATAAEARDGYKAFVREQREHGFRSATERAAKQAAADLNADLTTRLQAARAAHDAHGHPTSTPSERLSAEAVADAFALDSKLVGSLAHQETERWRASTTWRGDLVLDYAADEQASDVRVEAYLFDGDLTVEGDVVNANGDMGRQLLVKGQLRARHIIAGGSVLWIRGDLQATGAIFGHYNGGALVVGGNVRAEAIICSDHTLKLNGEVEGLRIGDDDHAEKSLEDALVPQVFTDDGFDEEKLITLLRKGKRYLASSKKKR